MNPRNKILITFLRSFLIGLVLFLGCPLSIFAQNYSFHQYTMEDGLPSNFVYGAFEDDEGYIWVYTENGISKFDGYEFKNFTMADGLPSNDVYHMRRDTFGNVFLINTANTLTLLVGDSILTPYPELGINAVPFPDGSPLLFRSDRNYYTIRGNEIDSFSRRKWLDVIKEKYPNLKKGRYTDFSFPFPSNWFLVFFDFNNGEYFSCLDSTCVSKKIEFNGKTDVEHPVYFDTERPFSVFRGKKGLVFISFEGDRFSEYQYPSETPPAHKVFSKISRNSICLHTPDHFLIFNDQFELINSIYPHQISKDYYLNRLVIDSQDNYWIGSKEGGLFFASKKSRNVEILPLYTDERIHFRGIHFFEGTLYLIDNKAKIYKYDREIGLELIFEPKKRSFYAWSKKIGNDIIIGNNLQTVSLATLLLPKKLEGLKVYRKLHHNNDRNSCKSLEYSDSEDKVYFSTAQETAIYHIAKDSLTMIYNRKVTFISKDSYSDKLFLVDIRDILIYENDEMKKIAELPDGVTGYFDFDKDFLWLGTGNAGVYSVNKNTGTVIKISDRNYVRKIKEKDGQFFLASNSGIVVLDKSPSGTYEEEYVFQKKDGLLKNEVFDIEIVGNEMYACVGDGVCKIDLEKVNNEEKQAQLNILSVKAGGKELQSGEVDRRKNNVAIKYLSLDYKSQGNIEYHYKLDPLESDWQITMEREVFYGNLPPGDYSFQLKAKDAYGDWTVLEAPITFTVSTHFWETKIFYGLLIIGFLGLVGFFVKKRERKQKALAKREKELNEKIASLQMTSLRSQMNPHFIFNALGSIQYFIQTHKVDEADDYLTKFARLMRKYLDSAIEKTIRIEEEVALLKDYTDLEMMRFNFSFETRIHISDNISRKNEVIPSMILQPFVENSINHGLQARETGGLLEITFKKEEDSIMVCEVKDNGIGILKSKRKKKKNHISRGMANIENRIEVLEKTKIFKIEKTITPQYANNDFPGTLVRLKFKKLNNEY